MQRYWQKNTIKCDQTLILTFLGSIYSECQRGISVMRPFALLRVNETIISYTVYLVSFSFFLIFSLSPSFSEEKKINFLANQGEYQSQENKLKLSGKVSVFYENTELKADEVILKEKEKKISARGNVSFMEKEKEITAGSIEYNIENKNAVFFESRLTFTPWYLNAKKMEKTAEKKFTSSSALFTTCDLSSPHYFFKARKTDIVLDEYISTKDILFYVRGIPLFYLPFYYRSLKERKMSIEIYPGYGENEGFYLRNIIGYPVSKNTYAKIYLDYLEKKGFGTGGEYNYNLPNNTRGTIFAYRIKEKDTLRERWNLRYAHWSQLATNLTLSSNLNLLNDYNFSNTYFREDWQRRSSDVYSYLNLSYSEKNFTLRMVTQNHSSWYIDHFRNEEVYAPQIVFVTQPSKLRLLPLFYNSSFEISNYYNKDKGFYEVKTEDSISLSERFNLSRKLVLVPQIILIINNKTDAKNLLRKYYQTNTNLRYRPLDLLSFDFGYVYSAEFGELAQTNYFSFFSQWQPNQRVDWRVVSGYNFINKEKDNLVNQLTYFPRRNISIYLGNTYSLERGNILSWQIESTLGKLSEEYLLFGFTYSAPEKYYLRTGFNYKPTKSWEIKFTGQQELGKAVNRYFEKEILLTRDLHCWILSFYYRDRPEVKELWFSLDLKIAGETRKSLYLRRQEAEWYPWR